MPTQIVYPYKGGILVLNFSAAAKGLDEKKQKSFEHTVLFVDDEPQNLRVYQAMAGNSFDIVTCNSGAEALKIIEQENPKKPIAAIVSDHIMPRMTGVELCVELRNRQHSAPRVILTGFADLESAIKAVNEAAVFKYLTKPVDKQALIKVVNEAVARYEQQTEQRELVSMIQNILEDNSELRRWLAVHTSDVPDPKRVNVLTPTNPEKLELVTLFVELHGLTSGQSDATPQGVFDTFKAYYEPLRKIIYEAGGITERQLGHRLVAIFGLAGTPVRHAALQAAISLVTAVPAIAAQIPPPYNNCFVSIGLAAGDLVCGAMDHEHRAELSIIGDCVNKAVRIQELSRYSQADGKKFMESYTKAVAFCEASLLGSNSSFQRVQLPKNVVVRDFNEIREIGIFGL